MCFFLSSFCMLFILFGEVFSLSYVKLPKEIDVSTLNITDTDEKSSIFKKLSQNEKELSCLNFAKNYFGHRTYADQIRKIILARERIEKREKTFDKIMNAVIQACLDKIKTDQIERFLTAKSLDESDYSIISLDKIESEIDKPINSQIDLGNLHEIQMKEKESSQNSNDRDSQMSPLFQFVTGVFIGAVILSIVFLVTHRRSKIGKEKKKANKKE